MQASFISDDEFMTDFEAQAIDFKITQLPLFFFLTKNKCCLALSSS